MEDFVRRYLEVDTQVKELETLYWDLKRKLEELERELDQHNADFEILRTLEEPGHNFSQEELNELRPLLGLYGTDIKYRLRLPTNGEADAEYVSKRQLYWKVKAERAPFGSARHMVAERAVTRYGITWAELHKRRSMSVPATLEPRF